MAGRAAVIKYGCSPQGHALFPIFKCRAGFFALVLLIVSLIWDLGNHLHF